MIVAYVLLALDLSQASASTTDTSLLVAFISLAGTLALVIGGIVQVYLSRQRKTEEKEEQAQVQSNVETKFSEVDEGYEFLATRLSELGKENLRLKERVATLEGRTAEQSSELRTRNERIDKLTGEIAVWQYKWEQLEKGTGGQGGSSGS